MKSFLSRAVSLLLIAGILTGYQNIQGRRALEREEAERLYLEQLADMTQYENDRYEGEGLGSGGLIDGRYEGEGQGFGGPIRVAVTVEGGQITAVDVLSHDKEDNAYYETALKILPSILAAQSTDVDTISGATFSSRGILAAVDAALVEAKK